MTHWTNQIKLENTALREALDAALLALRTIPQTRLDKYANEGDGDSALAYRKCAQEVDRLNLTTISEIQGVMAERGVL